MRAIIILCLIVAMFSCEHKEDWMPPVIGDPVLPDEPKPALLGASEITHVTLTEAKVQGTVIEEGSEVYSRGFLFNTNKDSVDHGREVLADGNFYASISGLEPRTKYYIKSIIKTKAGTFVNKVDSLRTKAVQDIDGNYYGSVVIGNQEWLTENLKVKRCNDGSPILCEGDGAKWSQLKEPAFSFYENNDSIAAIYGALYNWYAAAHPLIAPEGWRVPTIEDWEELAEFFGGPSQAGPNLMSKTGWIGLKYTPYNSVGFNALPNGAFIYQHDSPDFTFGALGSAATFWSTTEWGGNVQPAIISNKSSWLGTSGLWSRPHGFGIRLLKE